MPIAYALEPHLTAQEFQDVLVSSTLAERRPADDLERLDKMLRLAQIIVTARDGEKLVGISRAITDYSYCCYLSDLAVHIAYQGKGIGKRLIEETHKAAGLHTGLFLGPVDGFDQDYAAGQGDKGSVVLGGLLASHGDPLKALEFAECLLDPRAAFIECLGEEGRLVLGV